MTDSDADDAIHILMRFANDFVEVEDTIGEHQEVIKQAGSVWIGKMGKPLGNDHIKRITQQIKDGIPSYLILVQKVGTNYEAHQATIVEIARSLPKGQEKRVPKYYKQKGITPQVSFWTKVSQIKALPTKKLSEFHISSSMKPVPKALATSMAALFIIGEGTGMLY